MKTQILSRRNTPISVVGFLLFMTTTQIGCGVLFNLNRVVKLDPVVLTRDDLPMMRLRSSYRFRGNAELSFIVGFEQRWSGALIVRYWLFDSAYTAKKGVDTLKGTIGAALHFEPESNPEDVIGDATWCHVDWKSDEKVAPILFVKNNVVVLVHPGAGPGYRHSPHQLQFARDVARKIEAKITAVLGKK